MPELKIDRISPATRPNLRAVMRQNWSELLFIHWECSPESIQKLLPPGLTVDTFEGKAYIGLVPFAMSGVRPTRLPAVPFLSDFLECNVRTYVHSEGKNPGVWFFSLDAANLIAVKIARSLWKLPYFHAKMSLRKVEELEKVDRGSGSSKNPNGSLHSPGKLTREYSTRRLGTNSSKIFCETRYRVESKILPATQGTLEHFLCERYLLYAYSNRLLVGQVNHIPYPLQVAKVDSLEENLIAQTGLAPPGDAFIAHYASGVEVEAFRLRPAST